MWAGSDKMKSTKKEAKKWHPALLLALIFYPFVLITVDFQIFNVMWRPELGMYIILYGVLTHLLAIIGWCLLWVYTASSIAEKAMRIFARIGLALGILIASFFMLGTILTGSINPEITLKPDGYNHAYYLFPKQGYFTRRGYGIYIPVSDFTMEYYSGDVAMDYIQSYVKDDHFYIEFDGMDRMFRAESDHLYKFDLTIPQY